MNYCDEHINVCFLVCLKSCMVEIDFVLKIITTASSIHYFNNFTDEKIFIKSTENSVNFINLKIPHKYYKEGEKIENVFIILF